MLNLFEHCFDYRIQSHFQYFSITESCILCFHYYYLLNYHIQNIHENNILQVFSYYKYLVSFFNFHKLLMKQVLKILYYFINFFLLFIVSYYIHESYYIHTEQCVFFVILTFITHSFSFCHHNLLLYEQKCIFL